MPELPKTQVPSNSNTKEQEFKWVNFNELIYLIRNTVLIHNGFY